MKCQQFHLQDGKRGIYTNNTNQDAIIEDIDTSRIEKELENGKIVIIAGFQGINPSMDITTLGRGGSDTTAVAVAAKLKAAKCYNRPKANKSCKENKYFIIYRNVRYCR